jgi:hypothetical protein
MSTSIGAEADRKRLYERVNEICRQRRVKRRINESSKLIQDDNYDLGMCREYLAEFPVPSLKTMEVWKAKTLDRQDNWKSFVNNPSNWDYKLEIFRELGVTDFTGLRKQIADLTMGGTAGSTSSSENVETQDKTDVEMCRQFLVECGEPVSVEKLEAWMPKNEQPGEPGNYEPEQWQFFVEKANWQRKIRCLRLAGASDWSQIGIKVHREVDMIVVDNYADCAVSFHPRNKRTTREEIIEAVCMRDKQFEETDNEELKKKLKLDIDQQLSSIYLDYQQSQIDRDPSFRAQGKERYVPYWRQPGVAFEAIHVEGKPMFLAYDGTKFSTWPSIDLGENEGGIILKPVEDIGYDKYNFSQEEIEDLSPSTLLQSDSMEKTFETILETLEPYQVTERFHLLIDAAGVLLSYFQDKVRSVPYIFKLGGWESGKTRGLFLVSCIAYRPIMSVDITSANVFRFYGRDLEGVGTIIHDEISDQDIDRDKSLRGIYNEGYLRGAKVMRQVGDGVDDKKTAYFNCYGVKWFGANDLPKNKPFVSRLIQEKYLQGVPDRIDITDADIDNFRAVRKGLLLLRLLKAFETFDPVDTPLRGRSRELFTPLLCVVQGTKYYSELLEPLLELDRERRQEDYDSKAGHVARAVIEVWLEAVSAKIGEGIKDPEDERLLSGMIITEPIFVPNSAVIAHLNLKETYNEKGTKKILVNDQRGLVLSNWELGKIESTDLRGKSCPTQRIGDKVERGHKFDAQTIKQLQRRYGIEPVTVVTAVTENISPSQNEQTLDEHVVNPEETDRKANDDSENGGNSATDTDSTNPTEPHSTVTTVTSVTKAKVERWFGCQESGCTMMFDDPLKLLAHIREAGHGDEQTMKSWFEMRGLL